jgi:antirestriction protein ArdC
MKKQYTKTPYKNSYEVITDRILEMLKGGTVPWRKPWNRTGNVEFDWPKNLTSKRPYSGINVFMLSCSPFQSPFWLTFKQAADLGGSVKKGEKGYPVIFWKINKKQRTDEQGEKFNENIPMLKHYTVFNVDQCENIDPANIPTCPDEMEQIEFNPIEAAQAIIDNMKNAPEITHYNNTDRACYSPSFDKINMPAAEQFNQPERYYSTLFHELSHSTGHTKRLNRKELADSSFFGSHNYSKEELVAEFSASFLCGASGIENEVIEQSAAYIAGWSKKLRSEPKWAIHAAAAAQKAADLIQNIERYSQQEKDESQEQPTTEQKAA